MILLSFEIPVCQGSSKVVQGDEPKVREEHRSQRGIGGGPCWTSLLLHWENSHPLKMCLIQTGLFLVPDAKGEISVETNSSWNQKHQNAKKVWETFPWCGNFIFNLSWYEKSYQGIISSQHQIHFLVLINRCDSHTMLDKNLWDQSSCTTNAKWLNEKYSVLERKFPPRNDMENGQWDKQPLPQMWHQPGQVTDLMDYDSHTQNCTKISLDWPSSAGNPSPGSILSLIYTKCTASQTLFLQALFIACNLRRQGVKGEGKGRKAICKWVIPQECFDRLSAEIW